MKIVEKQNFVKVEGDVEVQQFGIIFNAKMVHMLSDSLYQDKILAIVRELSTNAYDSQVESGNTLAPLEVHLPTATACHFSIRDYGTGLSPDRVKNVYLFYGGSDRTESNDYTGGMGLGSKTPFCYHTKTFTVDSWYGGIHYIYTAYIGEDGKPNLALMSQTESDAPSGVKVQLPVNRMDISEFNYAASKVYPIFPVMPIITGNTRTITKPVYGLTSNDGVWKLRKNSDYDGCRIIMGNVAYPFEFDDTEVTTAQRNVMRSDFDIFVDVGAMSVEMSREGLSYDNRTKVKSRVLINKIITDFNARIQEEIDKCANLWEARRKYVELYDTSDVKVTDGGKMLYKGTKLFPTLHNTVDLSVLTVSQGPGLVPPLHIVGIRKDFYSSAKYEKSNRVNSVAVKSKTKFFINDLGLGSFVRAAEVSKDNECLVLLFKGDDATIKRAMEIMGCDASYFTPISTIPSPTVRQSGGKRGNITKIVNFKHMDYEKDKSASYWSNEADTDISQLEGVYVEFNRFQYRSLSGYLDHPKHLHQVMRILKTADIALPNIYGIKTADLKHVHKSKLISLHEYITKAVEANIKNFNMSKIAYYQRMLNVVCQGSYSNVFVGTNRLSLDILKHIAAKCTTDNLLTQFVKEMGVVQQIVKPYEQATALKRLAEIVKVDLPKDEDFVRLPLDKDEAAMYNKYTMLGFTSLDSRSERNLIKIAQYVDSIS